MDLWTFFWIFFTLTVVISVLESIHRKSKRRRAAAVQQRMLEEQLRNQSIAVYTIQANRGATEQQLFAASNSIKLDDLPPKYEDIIANNNNNNNNSGGASTFIIMPQQQHIPLQAPAPPAYVATSANHTTTSVEQPIEQAVNNTSTGINR